MKIIHWPKTVGILFMVLATLGVVYAQTLSDNSDQPVLTDPNTDVSGLSDEAVELKALEAANPTPATALPRSGTYWSAQHAPGTRSPWPPLPGDPLNLAAWPLGDGNVFILNDLNVDYVAVAASASANPMRTLVVGDPPFPGGTNNGTNVFIPNDESYPPPDYGTNLYISQWSLSNNVITGIASNTVAEVEYQLQGEPSLTQSNGWINVGEPIVGSATTNWTPLNPVTVDFATNELFRLRSDISSDGSGIPDWWETEYGLTGVDPNAFDAAGDGWTIYQKYAMGVSPNDWVVPPAPQGLTVSYDASTGTATICWLPSPGNVTGYVLTTPSGPVYPSATATGYADTDPNLAAKLTPNAVFNYLSVPFTLEASYAGGNSAPASANIVPPVFPNIWLVQGAQGSNYLAVSGLPAAAAIRLTRSDSLAEFSYNDDSFDTTYDVSLASFTNGLCYLSPSLTASPVDAYGNNRYTWFVQTVNAAGGVNGQTSLLGVNADLNRTDGVLGINPPYYDGRVQMQQNLIFQLRAASESQPFQFADYEANDVYPIGSSESTGLYYWDTNTQQEGINTEASLFTSPANCAYASLWLPDAGATWTDANGLTHAILTLDAFAPFEMNTRYRNFVFDPAALDASGLLDTASADAGILPYSYYPFNGYPLELYDPVYELNPTNFDPAVSLLATNQTRWLFAQWENNSTVYGDGSDTSITVAGANYVMASDARNLFGLPYLSAEIAQTNGGGVTLATLNAGDSLPADGYLYPEVAQPQLQTAEYDFWNAGGYYDSNGNYLPWDLLPGMDNFSPTNESDPALVVGLGSSIQIAGYAKESVLNGYSGAYGYLGQYFEQAYAIDTNGNITTTPSGVLSPFGTFFPTQPGATALVTMPDIDTGARGTGVVNVISLTVDKNHDGTMDTSFSGADATSQASPMMFWCNNNFDRWATDTTLLYSETEQDDVQAGNNSDTAQNLDPNDPDCNYINDFGNRIIPCTRDLEDFARLWVNGINSNLLANLPAGSTITLNWGDVGSPNSMNPTIDIFTAADPDGGIGYLTNETMATAQINPIQSPYLGRLAPGSSLQLNSSFFDGWAGSHFIWCGVSNGTGGLNLTIADANSNVLAQTTAYIQIVDIKQMYERWTVGDDSDLPPTNTPALLAEGLPTGMPAFQYPPPTTNATYILHVHGWNMPIWEKDRYAETEFKRLYWQGYQGRFGAFDWPTYTGFTTYNPSEFQAWNSAQGLLNLLTQLNAEYPGQVYLTAHSMGNVVAGEALRLATQQGLGQVVNTYIAMQGAVSAHCYDPSTANYANYTPPDCYADYWTNGASCYFNGSAGAGTYVNFFNTNDYALNKWLTDQFFKPAIGYSYDTASDLFYQGIILTTPLYFPTNTYQIFAYADPAWSYAIGAQAGVGGVFSTNNQVNLPSVWPPDPTENNYNEHFWHSAEFRTDNPQMSQFWQQVLTKMRLN